jgi:hypothetical protein
MFGIQLFCNDGDHIALALDNVTICIYEHTHPQCLLAWPINIYLRLKGLSRGIKYISRMVSDVSPSISMMFSVQPQDFGNVRFNNGGNAIGV